MLYALKASVTQQGQHKQGVKINSGNFLRYFTERLRTCSYKMEPQVNVFLKAAY